MQNRTFRESSVGQSFLSAAMKEALKANRIASAEKQECGPWNLLATSLESPPTFTWSLLTATPTEDMLDADQALRLPNPPSRKWPSQPTTLQWLIPGTAGRYEREQAGAQSRYENAVRSYEDILQRRTAAYEALCAIASKDEKVYQFKTAYRDGNSEAVECLAQLALDGSVLPVGFPNEHRCVYLAENRQLVVEYRAPTVEESVSSVGQVEQRLRRFGDLFNFGNDDPVSAGNRKYQVFTSSKTGKSKKDLEYTNIIAQLALKITSELYRADDAAIIDSTVLNIYVDSIDQATGHPTRPCILSLRTTRENFMGLELTNVDPLACCRHLGASVSRNATELIPVKPILAFDMSDRRFIPEIDVISTLDVRKNLMELSPGEFEHLIVNLFQRMGLETKLTQASRDGGVDCVAYDMRPIIGGKVVVQAKRYKNTVGVGAVRDLFGTMHNEGANKGILVTTSGYGPASFEFANGKPIELVSGSNLLYLLKEHAGIDAKIEMPTDWIDPVGDV